MLRHQHYVIRGLAPGMNSVVLLADLPVIQWNAIGSCASCVCSQNLNFVKTYERQHNVKIW